MAIELMGSGGFVVTGEDIAIYRRIAILKMMEIELATGLHHSRGNPFKLAAETCGVKAGSRKRTIYARYCEHFSFTPKDIPKPA